MKLLECIKLRHRANKYKTKGDIGGIAYINTVIKNGQTVFDIGAHKAGYLYFMQKLVGEKGKVYAFEPQSNLYLYLIKIKELFRWNNVTFEHLALSDTAGNATLFIPKNKADGTSSPGATIVVNKLRNDVSFSEFVETETLDSYCQFNNIKPDFLKIDVEGNELRILKGGSDILKTHKPKILIEIEARHVGREKVLETFEYMDSMHYTGYLIYGSNHIPLSDFDFEKHQDTNNTKSYCNNFIFE